MRVFIWLYANKTSDLRRLEGVYAQPLLPRAPYLSSAVSVHVTHFRHLLCLFDSLFDSLFGSELLVSCQNLRTSAVCLPEPYFVAVGCESRTRAARCLTRRFLCCVVAGDHTRTVIVEYFKMERQAM